MFDVCLLPRDMPQKVGSCFGLTSLRDSSSQWKTQAADRSVGNEPNCVCLNQQCLILQITITHCWQLGEWIWCWIEQLFKPHWWEKKTVDILDLYKNILSMHISSHVWKPMIDDDTAWSSKSRRQKIWRYANRFPHDKAFLTHNSNFLFKREDNKGYQRTSGQIYRSNFQQHSWTIMLRTDTDLPPPGKATNPSTRNASGTRGYTTSSMHKLYILQIDGTTHCSYCCRGDRKTFVLSWIPCCCTLHVLRLWAGWRVHLSFHVLDRHRPWGSLVHSKGIKRCVKVL